MSSHRVIIGPGSVSQNYWRDLWQYRGLLLFLAWRDVMVRYKQTAIGILWAVLRPVLTIWAMWFIGWLFGSTVPEGTPRILMVCAATLPWQFFATSFSETSNSLISNSNLLTKVYFPRLILPFSTVLVSAIDFAVAFLIMVMLMVWYAYLPGPEVFLLPVFVLLTLVVSFGARSAHRLAQRQVPGLPLRGAVHRAVRACTSRRSRSPVRTSSTTPPYSGGDEVPLRLQPHGGGDRWLPLLSVRCLTDHPLARVHHLLRHLRVVALHSASVTSEGPNAASRISSEHERTDHSSGRAG